MPSSVPSRLFPVLGNVAAIAAATYAIILGAGIVLKLSPLTYYVDDWVWLSFNLQDGAGSFCRITGHPAVTANLLLALNFNAFDASPLGRAVMTAAIHVGSMMLVGGLVVGGLAITGLQRVAIFTLFAAVGLSGALSAKLYWTFGVTDGLSLSGAAIAMLGVARFGAGRMGLALAVAGSVLATFSFGTGLVVWAAVTYALLTLRVRPARVAAYVVVGIFSVTVAMFALPSCEQPPASVGKLSFQLWDVIQTASVALGFLPAHVVGAHNTWATPANLPIWIGIGLILIALTVSYAIRLLLRGGA